MVLVGDVKGEQKEFRLNTWFNEQSTYEKSVQ